MTETSVTVIPDNNAGARQVPTVKTDPGQPGVLSGIALNPSYFRTIPGILKLVQLGIGIICLACASSIHYGSTHWFLFVASTSFIATMLWTFVYLFSIREAVKLPINWILSELINTGVMTILYVIAFIAQLSFWSGLPSYYRGSQIAAGVFGIFNAIAYAAGTYFLYVEWQSTNTQ